YRDVPNTPLYPFGYGLSYNTYTYNNLKISSDKLATAGQLQVSIDVTNTGKYAGEEVIQLYTRDLVGSITRPVKELKKFQKLAFMPGEKKTVTFTITPADLAFWRADLTYGAEPGDFKVFVGPNSRDVQEASFTLQKDGSTKYESSIKN
ncbi:MAG: fibronectin type III-like domain-contianing protein, partial [Hymenobacteraceae bacterium]|nr:fibronectin type III-like domain-contianing protein [Hymenobacteraceae bacterium]